MIEIRVPTEEDWPAMLRADGRSFGAVYSEQDEASMRSISDLGRFRIAVDGGAVVGCSGSFGFDMTLPGGAAVPTGGVTWVSVAVTHRRQGLLGRLLEATHEDIDEPRRAAGRADGQRGRDLRALRLRHRQPRPGHHASTATGPQLRPEFVPADRATSGIVEPEDALPEIIAVWERFRRQRPAS